MHVIWISEDEYWAQNKYLIYFSRNYRNMFNFFDHTVPIINQIMFTFYNQFIYVYEVETNESWYWNSVNFYISNRTLKYTY